MEDIIKEMTKEFFNDEEVDENEKKELETYFVLFLEAMASDDMKVEAMGNSILAITSVENFTPFELASMSATLICSACTMRAKAKGIESSKIFFERLVTSMERAMEDEFKELEDECKNGDCSCKC